MLKDIFVQLISQRSETDVCLTQVHIDEQWKKAEMLLLITYKSVSVIGIAVQSNTFSCSVDEHHAAWHTLLQNCFPWTAGNMRRCVGCAEHDSKIKQTVWMMRECCERHLCRDTPSAAVTFTPSQPKAPFSRLQLEVRERNKRCDNQCLFISVPRPIREADLRALSWDVPILHLSSFIKSSIST